MSAFLKKLARWRVPLGFACGVAVLGLARPTPWLLWTGLAVACVGEALRIWAAGHLEKSREVTQSGPYRWTRHPLYVGSTIMGVGLAMASSSAIVAIIVIAYLAMTLTAAIRTEEAFLRQAFGDAYDRYRAGAAPAVSRQFSVERAMRNREYRAATGLVVASLLLILRMWLRDTYGA